uniref:Uncharacterized protein n=1 Tax=Caenorhabditis tropicalis TaxID=1561998 RepID=A0A1I7TZK0_9PELO
MTSCERHAKKSSDGIGDISRQNSTARYFSESLTPKLTKPLEIENHWISQHIPAPESRRRDRSLRRLSERIGNNSIDTKNNDIILVVGTDNIPAVCYRTIYTIPPPENFAAQGIPSAFNRMFFGRSCFEI